MNGYRTYVIVLILCISGYNCAIANDANEGKDEIMKQFQSLNSASWKEVFTDSCEENWKEKWTLDGLKAKISHSPQGMDFWAGPTRKDDSCHAVIWTQQSFKGDIKIEYEYTRLDSIPAFVNILYVQATGSNNDPYSKDIAEWAQLREVPAMKMYFNHMNTYHISYATYPSVSDDPERDYIRARRYMPSGKGLDGTDLEPDYFNTGFFKPGETHKITVIKKNNDLYFYIRNNEKDHLCHWQNNNLPPITEGRIGLRHMCTRGARYRTFRVSIGDNKQ